MTAPDASTIVVKLAFPYAPLPVMLGYYRYGQIMPVEVDSRFDPRQDIRGSGVWRLKSFAPSQRIEYEKNPDWYDASKVHLDGIRYNTLPEYASALSQFSAGRLATYNVNAADVLSMKQRLPQLTMLANEEFPIAASWIRMSYLPSSPFLDDRVRKALSMLLDRNLYIKTFGNVDEYEKAGIDVPMRWHSPIPCGEDQYWLDPTDEKALGAGARFFKHDPAEAKKLMQAAGHNSALEQKFTYGALTAQAGRQAEVLKAMWEEGGLFKLNGSNVDFNSEFRPKYSQGSNKHEGIAYSGASGYPDVDGWLTIYYKSGSERSGHLDTGGKVDAELDSLIKRQRGELDVQKRTAIIQDFQKYAANKMYMLNDPGAATGFLLAWNWLGNFGTFRSKAGSLNAIEGWTNYWIDPKLKTA
jgi:peptide/nickel transport system substrate-binding protein